MTKRIIAFAASNSKKSINKKFVSYVAGLIQDCDVQLLDLNDYEMPIYSIDRQIEDGIPEKAFHFKKALQKADGIIISFAEHNGIFTAAYKNIYDWVSRIEKDVWNSKPMLLLATSQGERGAQSVLDFATKMYRRSNTNAVERYSLPNFSKNFNDETGITKEDIRQQITSKIELFRVALYS